MATVKSDFVAIQLSAAGIEAAGANGSLRITAAHMSYEFKPGSSVRVLTSEWAKVLSRETLNGKLVFEIAPVIAAPVKSQSKPAPVPAPQAEAPSPKSTAAEEGK